MSTLTEEQEEWEKMMACCFPCGFVWMKTGCGSTCCLNYCLGVVLGICCVHVCHACNYVGKDGTPGSPYAAMQQKENHDRVVTTQPKMYE